MSGAYELAFETSILRPESFWGEAGAGVEWTRPWEQVLDRSASPSPRWFAGGRLNTCHNAVDRHVLAGRGAATAVIYDSPITGAAGRLTYAEALANVREIEAMQRRFDRNASADLVLPVGMNGLSA